MTVEGKNLSDLAKKMVTLGTELNSLGANEETEETETPTRARKTKSKVEDDEDTVEETEEDDDAVEETEDDEDAVEDDEETEDDEDEESEDEEESLKLSKSDMGILMLALKNHKKKNGKSKTVSILRKFAPTSDKVKKSDLPKLLKLLKA